MHLGILSLAHQHGPVAVAGVFVVIKVAKYRLVCWRRDYVNEEVRELASSKLLDVKQASEFCCNQEDRTQTDEACVACGCPLWLRDDADEYKVQFITCGCTVHSSCLLDTATQQRGVTAPPITDPGRCLVLLRRFFGVDPPEVESLKCPSCGTLNSEWARLPEERAVISTTPSAAAGSAARALRRGDALCLSLLRQAILGAAGNHSSEVCLSPKFARWQRAARSESSLRALVKQEGPNAPEQLVELLRQAASDAAEQQSEASTEFNEAEDEQALQHRGARVIICRAQPAGGVVQQGVCHGPPTFEALQLLDETRRSYTAFLWDC